MSCDNVAFTSVLSENEPSLFFSYDSGACGGSSSDDLIATVLRKATLPDMQFLKDSDKRAADNNSNKAGIALILAN